MRTSQIEQLISRVKTKDPVLYEILRNLNLDSRDSGQSLTVVSETQEGIVTDLTALETAIAALQATVSTLATQAALNALESLFENHKDRHVSGGGDAFITTDFIDALVKRLRSVTADLEIGTIADGEFLKRSGTSIVGDVGGGGGTNQYMVITNGDPVTPEIIFDGDGDVVLVEIALP